MFICEHIVAEKISGSINAVPKSLWIQNLEDLAKLPFKDSKQSYTSTSYEWVCVSGSLISVAYYESFDHGQFTGWKFTGWKL